MTAWMAGWVGGGTVILFIDALAAGASTPLAIAFAVVLMGVTFFVAALVEGADS